MHFFVILSTVLFNGHAFTAGYESNERICNSLIKLEWADWPITRAKYEQALSDLHRLNKSLYSNNGHCRIQSNLIAQRESEEQLTAVFKLIDDQEIEAALAVLEQLNGKHGYPKFDAGNPNDEEFFG